MFNQAEIDLAGIALIRPFQGMCQSESCLEERMGLNRFCHYHMRLDLCGPCCVPSCGIPASAPGQSRCLNHGGVRVPINSAVTVSADAAPAPAPLSVVQPLPTLVQSPAPPAPASIPQDAPASPEVRKEQTPTKEKSKTTAQGLKVCIYVDEVTGEACVKTTRPQNKYCCSHGRLLRNGLCIVTGCGVIATKEGLTEEAKRHCFKHGGGFRCGVRGCGKVARGVRRAIFRCLDHKGSDSDLPLAKRKREDVKIEELPRQRSKNFYRKPSRKLREAGLTN